MERLDGCGENVLIGIMEGNLLRLISYFIHSYAPPPAPRRSELAGQAPKTLIGAADLYEKHSSWILMDSKLILEFGSYF